MNFLRKSLEKITEMNFLRKSLEKITELFKKKFG